MLAANEDAGGTDEPETLPKANFDEVPLNPLTAQILKPSETIPLLRKLEQRAGWRRGDFAGLGGN